MDWYYVENDQQAGPIDEAALESMIVAGRITPETLVWREGMANWSSYGTVVSSKAAVTVAGATQCAECGNMFAPDDLVQIGSRSVCAACKPLAMQKLKEGVDMSGVNFRYAGFWMRFAAAFVDGLIMLPISGVYLYVLLTNPELMKNVGLRLAIQGAMYLIALSYSTFFLGRFGSTPGMMACGIRVVRPDGEKITYLRAVGRYFAAMLSSWTIGIGFFMIAFDDQKRALHDRICDTRVVYKN